MKYKKNIKSEEEPLTEEYLRRSKDLLDRIKENNKLGQKALDNLRKNGLKKQNF